MDNERFERIKAMHPDWSDEQIWIAVSIDLQQDQTIRQQGDIDPNDPVIWEIIIRKAKDWLQEVWPVVFEKVKEIFAGLLNKIKEWISNKIPVVIDWIREFIGANFVR